MSDKARVRWLCRRGMKELDVLLEAFVARDYDTLSADEHDELLSLLACEDPDLYALIMQRSEPENALQADLVRRIRGRR